MAVDEKPKAGRDLDTIPEQPHSPIPSPPTPIEPLSYAEPESGTDVATLEGSRSTGVLRSLRGVIVLLVTCMAQLIDIAYLSAVTIALPQIARELDLPDADLPWVISAYTLAFGGHLLLAGVLSDRYSRKWVFCGGMAWLTVWSVAVSLARDKITIMIFRAFQGLGAAATVPSSIGTICTFFSGRDQSVALAAFGGSGAVGYIAGIVLGGILAGTIGWRYIFRILPPVTAIIAIVGWFAFPPKIPSPTDERPPSLDFAGAGLGTVSMVLLVFAFSSSETAGWGKAIVIAPLVISLVCLAGFLFAERKVKNPIMPLSFWKEPGFAAIWFTGLFFQAWWGACTYYTVLIAQEVLGYPPLETALRFIPLGGASILMTACVGPLLDRVHIRWLIIGSLIACVTVNAPSAVIHPGGSYWSSLFITSILGGASTAVTYNTLSIALVAIVPPNAKSLAGALIATSFQIGTAIGLALCSIVQNSVLSKYGDHQEGGLTAEQKMEGYSAGLWMATGCAGLALLLSIVGLRKLK